MGNSLWWLSAIMGVSVYTCCQRCNASMWSCCAHQFGSHENATTVFWKSCLASSSKLKGGDSIFYLPMACTNDSVSTALRAKKKQLQLVFPTTACDAALVGTSNEQKSTPNFTEKDFLFNCIKFVSICERHQCDQLFFYRTETLHAMAKRIAANPAPNRPTTVTITCIQNHISTVITRPVCP